MPKQEEYFLQQKQKEMYLPPFFLGAHHHPSFTLAPGFFSVLSSAFPFTWSPTQRSQECCHDLMETSQWRSVPEGSDGDVSRVTAWRAVGMEEVSRHEDEELKSQCKGKNSEGVAVGVEISSEGRERVCGYVGIFWKWREEDARSQIKMADISTDKRGLVSRRDFYPT